MSEWQDRPAGEVAQAAAAISQEQADVQAAATHAAEAPEPAPAGEPELIDRLQERLRELDQLPVSEHPERYEALHAELSEALTVLDRAARSDAAAVAPRR